MNNLETKQTTEQETDPQPEKKMPARYNLYAQMNVSLKSVDRFILIVGILIVVSIVLAIR